MDCERWQVFGERALKAIAPRPPNTRDSSKAIHSSNATIAFVSDRQIRELNKQFRGSDKPTDVLSFPAETDEFAASEPNLGDIAVSVERAEVQAKENGLSYDQEIAQLILHGLLHLCGYDHETDDGEMNRLEMRLRKQLRI